MSEEERVELVVFLEERIKELAKAGVKHLNLEKMIKNLKEEKEQKWQK